MKEEPLFCFLLPAEGETSMFHISTSRGGRQPHQVLCLKDMHSLVLKRLLRGLVEVGPSHQENEIYQGVGEWAGGGIIAKRSAVLPEVCIAL